MVLADQESLLHHYPGHTLVSHHNLVVTHKTDSRSEQREIQFHHLTQKGCYSLLCSDIQVQTKLICPYKASQKLGAEYAKYFHLLFTLSLSPTLTFFLATTVALIPNGQI